MTAVAGWNDADTARLYERFCRRHRRYRVANEALAANAALEPGLRILDVAAGTGRTAEAALSGIGARGTVLCVEPASAMRSAGMARLRDARVTWTSSLPDQDASFDRIVCGAAIWQLLPLDATIARLARLLAPGGALVFNVPALYLLQPDAPGGGGDPHLLGLATLIERSAESNEYIRRQPGEPVFARSAGEVDTLLVANQLRAKRWSFELRLTQAAYRDWLKIPPTSDGMLAGLSLEERMRRIDRAYALSDTRSWRWERWLGWTAWRTS